MTAYLPQTVETELDDLLLGLPAPALEEPEGGGKTETARRKIKPKAVAVDFGAELIATFDEREAIIRE
jgi:hypothetical protein